MPIEIKMPALSPTMEEGTLAKWLVKEGDTVSSGDILAEIETDKATMEFETIDEGTVVKLLVAEGSDGVKVGAVIAIIAAEGEDASAAPAPKAEAAAPAPKADPVPAKAEAAPAKADAPKAAAAPAPASDGSRVKASPLARRLAEQQGVDLGAVAGSGPNGRIVKADLDGKAGGAPAAKPAAAASDACRCGSP
jgi:pyruvate dehydrogenase E2 component (dihydrolipoamide acetyltransferase)